MVSYKIFDIVALPEDTIDTATSNDPWGPIRSEMAGIADMTFNKYGHLDIDTGYLLTFPWLQDERRR
jgi:ENTH domain